MIEKEIVNAFLLKEAAKTNNSFTDGKVLLYYGTCLAEWKNSSILLNDSHYNWDIDNAESYIDYKVKKSALLYRIVSKEVPIGSKTILKYE